MTGQDKSYPRNKKGQYQKTTGTVRKIIMRVTEEERELILMMRRENVDSDSRDGDTCDPWVCSYRIENNKIIQQLREENRKMWTKFLQVQEELQKTENLLIKEIQKRVG